MGARNSSFIRLINPLLESAEESKINTCVNSIYDIWNNGKENKLTQLVFCDLATPKQIAKLHGKIEAMKYDIVALQNQFKGNSDEFSPMTINNITYTEKEDAGKKLLECCQSIKSFEDTDTRTTRKAKKT